MAGIICLGGEGLGKVRESYGHFVTIVNTFFSGLDSPICFFFLRLVNYLDNKFRTTFDRIYSLRWKTSMRLSAKWKNVP